MLRRLAFGGVRLDFYCDEVYFAVEAVRSVVPQSMWGIAQGDFDFKSLHADQSN